MNRDDDDDGGDESDYEAQVHGSQVSSMTTEDSTLTEDSGISESEPNYSRVSSTDLTGRSATQYSSEQIVH